VKPKPVTGRLENWVLPDIDVWDAENIFYLKANESRIGKLLAQHAIYTKIVGIPGDILECGVFKGASLMRLAAFRRLLENDHSRSIIGFDIFGKFPTTQVSSAVDLEFIKHFESIGGNGISKVDLEAALHANHYQNVSLIHGNIYDSLPEWKRANSHRRVALLHLDLDVYEPTRFALNCVKDLVVPGGIIIIDDYAIVEGATRAVDEFLRKEKRNIVKLNYYKAPSYICM